MAGRKRAGGAAAAVNLLTQLMIQKQQDQRARANRAQEMYEKFAYELVLEQVKKGTLAYNPKTGKMEAATPAPKPPTGGFMPQPQVNAMLGSTPQGQGVPLPETRIEKDRFGDERTISNIPVGQKGINSMNAIIGSGMVESPSAEYARKNRQHLFTDSEIPGGPFFPGPNGTAVSGATGEAAPGAMTIPRSGVQDILNRNTDNLPDPTGYKEGTVIEDDQSGQRYRLMGGEWVSE